MLGSDGATSSATAGIAFLVAAGSVAEFIAKACSSPQTTELNADKRAPTLMKWVNLGALEAVIMVGIAMMLEKHTRLPILMGALVELGITYWEYDHARRAGLASTAPATEKW